ncbi:hypothetical protein DIS24_g10888 [Lasiodiplodia hormozganensis]|uniref:Letm1 RBD domain-containing protein n=1 Tax=Lasiodiplodia hormozganensis TaxID=869390 RepID=A0AA39X6T0_9PEZI|nr:hypothetical protein DIS24_g10888 [Lasiodiplodia hormozganensis]
MISRIGSARVAPSPFALTPLQFACRRAVHQQAATSPSRPPSKSQPKLDLINRERANPPVSTLPELVDVPPRRPDQNILSYGLQSGKAYWKFYKAGVKSIWNNRKLAKAVLERLRQNKEPFVQIKPGMDALDVAFTRGEFQLLRRSQHDMRRVPAFAVLLLLCGEWLPVIVIFVDGLVPLPCRIPRQVEKAERKREDQRRGGRKLLADTQAAARIDQHRVPQGDGETMRALDTLHLNLDQAAKNLTHSPKTSVHLYLHHAATNFNVRSTLWDRTKAYTIMPSILWMIKLRRHLRYLTLDDALLRRDGGVDALRPEEVLVACTDRGIDITGKAEGQWRPDAQLRADLKEWLQKRRGSEWLKLLFEKNKA